MIRLCDSIVLVLKLSQGWQLRRHLHAQAVRLRLGVFQNAFGERFVGSQKFADILFEDELGVKFSPIVRCAHESEEEIQLLQVERSERAAQGPVRICGVGSLEKDMRGARE